MINMVPNTDFLSVQDLDVILYEFREWQTKKPKVWVAFLGDYI